MLRMMHLENSLDALAERTASPLHAVRAQALIDMQEESRHAFEWQDAVNSHIGQVEFLNENPI